MLRVNHNHIKNVDWGLNLNFHNFFINVNLVHKFTYFLCKSTNKNVTIGHTTLKTLRFNLKNQNKNNIGFYRAI